jgi:hypothetical protein
MQTQDRPTSGAFITALRDGYLLPRDDGYAVFWRTSGQDLCTVERGVAEQALHGAGRAVRLGTWSGTIDGRRDEWTVWWAHGLPWVSTSDVADGDQTLRLIEQWRAKVARAEARGQRWDPPASTPPAPAASAPSAAGRARGAVLGGLRMLLGGR